MRVAKIAVLARFPVLWPTVLLVRSQHFATHLNRVEVKGEFVGNRKKPNVLGRILPVLLCSAALFAFPCDAVLQLEILRANTLNSRTRPPITADINRSRWFQKRNTERQPRVEPRFVFVGRTRPKR